MPSHSSVSDSPGVSTPVASAASPLTGVEQSTSHRKGQATQLRRREERRTEKLEQMRAQVADGTLVIRQMTVAERQAAVPAEVRPAGRSRARRSALTAP
jgi:hypothetical protein